MNLLRVLRYLLFSALTVRPVQYLFSTFPPAFHHLFSGGNRRKSLQIKEITADQFRSSWKDKYMCFCACSRSGTCGKDRYCS